MMIEVVTEGEFRSLNGASIPWPDSTRPPNDNFRHLFETGAVARWQAGQAEPTLIDPPQDEEQRLRLQEQYQQLCVQRAAAAFAALRKTALSSADMPHAGAGFRWPEDWAGPAPQERFMGQLDAVAGLKRLAEIHDQHFKAAFQIAKRLASLPAVAQRRAEAERRATEREAERQAEEEAFAQQREAVMAVRLAGQDLPADAGEIDVLRSDHRWTSEDQLVPAAQTEDHWAELTRAIHPRGR